MKLGLEGRGCGTLGSPEGWSDPEPGFSGATDASESGSSEDSAAPRCSRRCPDVAAVVVDDDAALDGRWLDPRTSVAGVSPGP